MRPSPAIPIVLLACAACTGPAKEPIRDAGAGSDAGADAGVEVDAAPEEPTFDVTFFVVGDPHCDPMVGPDDLATVRAIDRAPAEAAWPDAIGANATGFLGGPVAAPRGVLLAGDVTGSGDLSPWSNELATFRALYEPGGGADSVAWPVYVGLGNHDLDRDDLLADAYRQEMWDYVASRHAGDAAPAEVSSFDPASGDYAVDFERVHVLQTHKWAGDVTHGHASGLDWLAADLAANAADGRPVVIVEHFGMDAFGTEDRWWTAADRAAFYAVIAPYNVIAIFAGHSHAAMAYLWNGILVFQVNNTDAEIGEGNDDGNGSFAIVRVTESRLELVTCRWTSEAGDFELVAPYYTTEITAY
jgi:cytolysin (calcineurin-like family phosphatase)